MKKFLPLLVIGVLVLSGLGAVALQSDDKKLVLETIEYKEASSITTSRGYTHTVLVEVGTRTTCPACPASNAAWHSIYGGGNYDFEYTELVYDKNSVASSRFYEFNPKWVPTSYWDGGEYVYPGTNTATFYNYLDSSGSRTVPDLVADLDVTWLGGADMEISYSVENNDVNDYPGKLRIYVIELESTLWNDYSGNPYYHAFLDFAVNQVIDIPGGGTLSDTIMWDGGTAGYPDITQDNIQMILAVFDDTPHQSYSDPPSGNPFWAYYSDECIAAIPEGGQNNPPEAPDIDGPASGNTGTSYDYTFTSTDPDGDDVKYYIKWGDGDSEWTSFVAPGTPVTVSHTWSAQGTFSIEAKAKDSNNAESGYSTLTVTMPFNQNQMTGNSVVLKFLQRLSQILPLSR